MQEPAVRVRPRTNADLARCAEILVRVHERDGYPIEGVADPLARLQFEGLVDAWVAEASDVALVLDVMLKDAAAIRLHERLGWRALGDALHDGGSSGMTLCRWYAWESRGPAVYTEP